MRRVYTSFYLLNTFSDWLRPYALSALQYTNHRIRDVFFHDAVFWGRYPGAPEEMVHIWVARAADYVDILGAALYVRLHQYGTDALLYGEIVRLADFDLDKHLKVVQPIWVNKSSAVRVREK